MGELGIERRPTLSERNEQYKEFGMRLNLPRRVRLARADQERLDQGLRGASDDGLRQTRTVCLSVSNFYPGYYWESSW